MIGGWLDAGDVKCSLGKGRAGQTAYCHYHVESGSHGEDYTSKRRDLVWRGAFGLIDDEEIGRGLTGLKFQAQLFFKCGKDRGSRVSCIGLSV